MDVIPLLFSEMTVRKNSFFEKLNDMHVNLEFTIENAVDNKLDVLDVLVHWDKHNFYTSIYL